MTRQTAGAVSMGLALLAVTLSLHGQDAAEQQKKKAGQAKGPRVQRAVAVLVPTEGSDVSGTIYFTQRRGEVEVTGHIRGLEPGKHGFHVHQYGDLTNLETGASAGGHFNPTGMPHGRPDEEERHVGDLGNIEADQNGMANVNISDPMLRLNGPQSILGRAIVVHAKADEFTQPSGDAGDRVALGVIGVAQPQRGSGQGDR